MRHAMWLLVAIVMLAASPGFVPVAAQVSGPQFQDVTDSVGIGNVRSGFNPDGTPSGDWNAIAIADYDGDGDDDILLNLHPGFALFTNQGNGTFTRGGVVGLPAPITDVTDHRHLLLWCDIDKDLDDDLIIGTGFSSATSGTRVNLWMRNNGDGTFSNIAAVLAVEDPGSDDWATTCADVDRNGWLDVFFLRNSPQTEYMTRLWANYSMQFRQEAQLRGFYEKGSGQPYAAPFADFSGDGYPEGVFTGNNVQSWALNRGNGFFSLTTGVYDPISSLSPYLHDAEFGDFNGDLLIDAVILDTFGAAGEPTIWVHCNNGKFNTQPQYMDGLEPCWKSSDIGIQTGAGGEATSVGAGDFDNDGDLDMFVIRRGGLLIGGRTAKGQDVLLVNDGTGKFVNAFSSVPILNQFYAQRVGAGGVAVMDYDMDGRLDMLVGYNSLYMPGPFRVYRNVSAPRNWIGFRLSAPLVLGANVQITACGKKQVRQLQAGTGWLAQDAKIVHFGLGDCAGPVSARIAFPEGQVVTADYAPNRYHAVGGGVVPPPPPPPPPPVVISGTWTTQPFVDNNDTHRWISPGIVLSGGTAPYSVTFRLGTLLLCSGQANPSIQCAYVPLGTLPNGSYAMTAEVRDAEGNSVTLSQAYTVK